MECDVVWCNRYFVLYIVIVLSNSFTLYIYIIFLIISHNCPRLIPFVDMAISFSLVFLNEHYSIMQAPVSKWNIPTILHGSIEERTQRNSIMLIQRDIY